MGRQKSLMTTRRPIATSATSAGMEAVEGPNDTDFWGPEGAHPANGEDFKYFAKEDLENSGLLPLPEERASREPRHTSIVDLIDFKECDRASDASTTTPRLGGVNMSPAIQA